MRQWISSALVQITACRLFVAKPLSKPMLGYCQLELGNKPQWNFNQNEKLFFHKNASENIVCEMTAILSRGRWVNILHNCHCHALAHFTNDFSYIIQMRWKLLLAILSFFHGVITTKFCTCYDSCAVVTCAKPCSNMITKNANYD